MISRNIIFQFLFLIPVEIKFKDLSESRWIIAILIYN